MQNDGGTLRNQEINSRAARQPLARRASLLQFLPDGRFGFGGCNGSSGSFATRR